ncbi:hypothetical protein V1634_19775 [Plantactinospora veratri]|uniref:Uncharacterized protein n=1 Tax=Plantactinospora veratri TaxID=1436122 RepID=A0ABU7SGL4_9ACTN
MRSRPPYPDERGGHIPQALRSGGRAEAGEVAAALGLTGETVGKDPSDIDLLVTDTGLPDGRRRELTNAGLRVEYA